MAEAIRIKEEKVRYASVDGGKEGLELTEPGGVGTNEKGRISVHGLGASLAASQPPTHPSTPHSLT